MKNIYKVGGHCFSVGTDTSAVSDIMENMKNYTPFLCTVCKEYENLLFNLDVSIENNSKFQLDGLKKLADFDDDIAYISIMSDLDNNIVFLIALNKSLSNDGGILKVDKANKTAHLYLNTNSELYHQNFIVNNSIMLLYAMFSSTRGTLLIHSSVVVNDNKGYAFLGRSGTGKSTHTRLWLKYIQNSILLNDDNPVVRVLPNGKAMIYGSPWSGKTPCYKNEEVVLKSVVRLTQAPYNKITPLKGIAAYAAFSPSASAMKWDKEMADGLHKTFSELINIVGIYHLECLPDEDAARTCFNAVK